MPFFQILIFIACSPPRQLHPPSYHHTFANDFQIHIALTYICAKCLLPWCCHWMPPHRKSNTECQNTDCTSFCREQFFWWSHLENGFNIDSVLEDRNSLLSYSATSNKSVSPFFFALISSNSVLKARWWIHRYFLGEVIPGSCEGRRWEGGHTDMGENS